jgi:hypothetical protein
VRATVEVARAEGRAKRPREVDANRVVIRDERAVRLQEARGVVEEVGRAQRDDLRAAVEHLVDDLAASVERDRVVAHDVRRARGRDDAAVRALHPRVREPVLGDERAEADVRRARVARVGVAEHEDSVADGVVADEVRHLPRASASGRSALRQKSAHLLQVRATRGEVTRVRARVRVEVDRVEVHALLNARAHEREALRGEAVGAGVVRAGVPLDALEVDPVEVGEGVEAIAERGCMLVSHAAGKHIWNGRLTAAAGRRPVGVVVVLVQGGVIVEVLMRESR